MATLFDWLEAQLEAERHQLPLFIPVCLGAGIALWFGLPGPWRWGTAIFAGGAVAAGGALVAGRLGQCLFWAGLLVSAGVLLAWGQAERHDHPVLAAPRFNIPLTAEVLAIEHLDARGRTRLLLAPRSQLPADMQVRISVRGELDEAVGPGARVALRASLSPPPGPIVPGGYHFARRAWFEGIGATGFALGGVEVLRPAPPPSGLSDRLAALRAGLTASLVDGVGGPEGGVAAALVTGERGAIPEQVTEAMRDSGLAHLIAISGLHIAAVTGGMFLIVRRGLSLWPWFALRFDTRLAAALAAAVAGIAYTLIAGAGVPTLRACLAVLIVLLGTALGREAISLRLVAAGAVAILVWRPDLLISPSFQLSFAAVTGIVALYQSPWGRRWSERRQDAGRTERLRQGITALFVTGIVAEATIAPIALAHFNQVGLYGASANLIAIPLTSFVILPLLILSVLLIPFGLAAPVFIPLKAAIGLLIAVAAWTAALPGAVAIVPTLPLGAVLLIVFGGLWICLMTRAWRLLGAAPILAGLMWSAAAPRPDLIVSPDGEHMALVGEGGSWMLRPRAGDYVRSMWSGATGVEDLPPLDEHPAARCSPDSCIVAIQRGERTWHILATRSRRLIPREDFAPACAAADIVVSARRLPSWCQPRWLKLDRESLDRLGAVSIDLDRAAVSSSGFDDGCHPWAAALRSPPLPPAQ